MVTFRGRVAVVRQDEVDLLKRVQHGNQPVDVVADVFRASEEVRITSGAFAGYHGKVVRCHGFCRVALRIDELGFAVVIDVPSSSVQRSVDKLAEVS